jgi:hypothetical protein
MTNLATDPQSSLLKRRRIYLVTPLSHPRAHGIQDYIYLDGRFGFTTNAVAGQAELMLVRDSGNSSGIEYIWVNIPDSNVALVEELE